MLSLIIAANVIALAFGVAALIYSAISTRKTARLWAQYHPGAEFSPTWTGENGKRYRMHIPTQRIIDAQ
jgi:hypothetical protein